MWKFVLYYITLDILRQLKLLNFHMVSIPHSNNEKKIKVQNNMKESVNSPLPPNIETSTRIVGAIYRENKKLLLILMQPDMPWKHSFNRLCLIKHSLPPVNASFNMLPKVYTTSMQDLFNEQSKQNMSLCIMHISCIFTNREIDLYFGPCVSKHKFLPRLLH